MFEMTNEPLSKNFIKNFKSKVDWSLLIIDPYHCEIEFGELHHRLIIGHTPYLCSNANYLGIDYKELIEKFESFGGKMMNGCVIPLSLMHFKNKEDIKRAKEWVDALLVMKKLTTE